ncbi:MAG: T9SS type A sorting domain-containing protein [Bacteroidales bacterium]
MKAILNAGICLCLLLSIGEKEESQVFPQKSGSNYTFTFGPLFFAVDTNKGGRIVSLKYAGHELLYLQSTQDMNGSTFWPSPQSLWGWPPLPNIDNKTYGGRIIGNKLLLTSKVDPTLHVRVYKSFALDTTDTTLVINYYLKNEGSAAVSLAPWEITRVPIEGPIVFSLEDGQVTGNLAPQTVELNSHLWYDQQNTQGSNSKFFANGRGWLAFINANNKLVFLKKFSDIISTSSAPSEAEIEVYTAGDRSYSELENQGQYVAIAPKDSVVYAVRWAVRALPANISITIGDTTLTNFIDSLASHLRLADTLAISTANQIISLSYRNIAYQNGRVQLLNFNPKDFPLQLIILDINGKIVWQQHIATPVTNFPTPTLPQGTYLLNIQDDKHRQISTKVVILQSF